MHSQHYREGMHARACQPAYYIQCTSRISFLHMLRKRIYRQVDELEVSMLGNHMDKDSMWKIAINTFMIKMHALLKLHVCMAFYTHAFQSHFIDLGGLWLLWHTCHDNICSIYFWYENIIEKFSIILKLGIYNYFWTFKIFSRFKTNTHTIQYHWAMYSSSLTNPTDIHETLNMQLWMEQVVENSLNWSCSM